MTTALIEGFLISLGLIVAIGPQNAFLLRQSIKREHAVPVAAICIASDILLIGMGVMGVGRLIMDSGLLHSVLGWGGVVFLLWYGLTSLRGAVKGEVLDVDTGPARRDFSVPQALVTALGITWLNPHVYVDTLVLISGVSLKYADIDDRLGFMLGAWAGSVLWFVSLAAAGRMLAPLFARPLTWRILDLIIAAIMLTVAVGLAVSLLNR